MQASALTTPTVVAEPAQCSDPSPRPATSGQDAKLKNHRFDQSGALFEPGRPSPTRQTGCGLLRLTFRPGSRELTDRGDFVPLGRTEGQPLFDHRVECAHGRFTASHPHPQLLGHSRYAKARLTSGTTSERQAHSDGFPSLLSGTQAAAGPDPPACLVAFHLGKRVTCGTHAGKSRTVFTRCSLLADHQWRRSEGLDSRTAA